MLLRIAQRRWRRRHLWWRRARSFWPSLLSACIVPFGPLSHLLRLLPSSPPPNAAASSGGLPPREALAAAERWAAGLALKRAAWVCFLGVTATAAALVALECLSRWNLWVIPRIRRWTRLDEAIALKLGYVVN